MTAAADLQSAANPSAKITASDLRAALVKAHPQQEYVLLFEVNEGTGVYSGRRADAVLFSLWPSRGLTITVFELKVSRSDWLTELKDPDKMEAIGRHADYITLVTAPGVVKAGELPPGWGHYELRGDKLMRLLHPQQRGDTAPIPRSMLMAFMRAKAKLDGDDLAALQARIRKEVAKEYAELEQRLSRTRPGSADLSRVEKGMEKLAAIKEATGIDLTDYHPPAHWIAKIKLAGSSRYRAALVTMQMLLTDAKLAATLQRALDDTNITTKKDAP